MELKPDAKCKKCGIGLIVIGGKYVENHKCKIV